MDADQGDAPMIATPDPGLQHDLVRENVPDPLAGEQTWPTEEVITQIAATCVGSNGGSMHGVLLLTSPLMRIRCAQVVEDCQCQAHARLEHAVKAAVSEHAVCCMAGQLTSCSSS